MEPQLFSCGLSVRRCCISLVVIALQWSRNFSVADCAIIHCLMALINWASMEPQLFSCGLHWIYCNYPWVIVSLQWSRNFSVADCPSSARARTRVCRFNGAATFQLRIEDAMCVIRKDISASMEPQLFSCGLLIMSLSRLSSSGLLQWSRNFSVADWMSREQETVCADTRFNGAATFQLRIVVDWPVVWDDNRASMEPQLFSCGLPNLTGLQNTVKQLQWSRNFSVADWRSNTGDDGSRWLCFNGAATFQLRIDGVMTWWWWNDLVLQWSRNFSVADWPPLRFCRFVRNCASMEPQLFSCGLFSSTCSRLAFFRLQWSRNFSVADCWFIFWWIAFCSFSFNGAATFQLRIVMKNFLTTPSQSRFNGAATFQLRIAHNHKDPSDHTWRFNGAATFQLRIALEHPAWNSEYPCFNGAATFQLRIAPYSALTLRR